MVNPHMENCVYRMRSWTFIVMIVLAFAPVWVGAQNVAEVWLGKTAALFQNKGVELRFRLNEEGVRTNGRFLMEGEKFCFDTDDMKIWFDGTTLWTLQNDISYSELYISNPTDEELRSINPYMLLQTFDEYFLPVDEGDRNVGDEWLHVISLVPKTSQQDLSKMVFYLTASGEPKIVDLVLAENREYRIEIRAFRNGLTFSQHTFTYREKEYPANEVIDMR